MNGSSMGMCLFGTYEISAAQPGESMTPITYVGTQGYAILVPRLGLAGDFAVFATQFSDANATINRIVTAHYDAAAKTWFEDDVLPINANARLFLLTPTAGPLRHVAYIDTDRVSGALTFYELVSDGVKWSEQAHYALAPLGLTVVAPYDAAASMTADGLHVVVTGQVQGLPVQLFSDRASITDAFGPFRVIDSVPSEGAELFMTDDCGQLYFRALQHILYFDQN